MKYSEHGIYAMVKSAMERSEKHGFEVHWTPDGWLIERRYIRERGASVVELHQYLNGYEDAISVAREEQRGDEG